jgi:xanthine dehydrogenase accessory factor
MDRKVLEFIDECLERGERAALVTLTHSSGSTPRSAGSIMAVDSKGSIMGSIGGGKLEAEVIVQTKEAILKGENEEFHYRLTEHESLKMVCGGDADGFIKVFIPKEKLLIIGAGHVGTELYNIGTCLNFEVTIIDDREEFANVDRLPNASRVMCGDIGKMASEFPVDSSTYIIIVSRGHSCDAEALKAVIGRDAAYIGMIGSGRKTTKIMTQLLEEGIERDELEKVYAPIGIDMGSQLPNEIALGILAEVLVLKNGGQLAHMKNIKNLKW